MSRVTLLIPAAPPSLNAVGYRSHWAVGRREKLRWQRWLSIALMERAVPRGLEGVSASAEIRFRQRRRRDEGLGDALVEGRWLPDDTADRFHFGAVRLVAPSPEASTLIRLLYE